MADASEIDLIVEELRYVRHERKKALRILVQYIHVIKLLGGIMATTTQQIMDALDALDVSEGAEQEVVQAAITLLKARPDDQLMTQILTRIGARKAASDAETADVQAAVDAANAAGSGASGGSTSGGSGSTGDASAGDTGSTTPPAGGDTGATPPSDVGGDSGAAVSDGTATTTDTGTGSTTSRTFNPNSPSRAS